MIRVLVVDDDDNVRAGIAVVLNEDAAIEVVAQADDGLSAIRMATAIMPDVIIMDIAMPLIDGVEATRHLVDALPDTRILAVSSHTHVERVREIVDAGASGFVLKDDVQRDLISAVRMVADGMVFLSPVISRKLLHGMVPEPVEGNEQTQLDRE